MSTLMFVRRTLVTLFIFLVLAPALARGQQTAVISGRAVDGADGTPVALATIVILNAASGDTLSGAIADNDGRFRIRGLAPGRYLIHANFVGFQSAQSNVLVSELNSSYDLGDLRMTRVIAIGQIDVTANAIRAAGVGTE